MNRVVRGADGRMWNIHTNLEWSNPITVGEFEHDVSGGAGPSVLMGGVVMLYMAIFILWTPSGVIVPAWLLVALVLVVLFFPGRWLWRRPWTVIAETPGDQDERPPERWVGVIRGVLHVRQETTQLSKDIEVYSEPDVNGPLQPVE